MNSQSFQNKCVLILGAGREGQSTASYLRARVPSCDITLADLQPISVSLPGVRCMMGKDYPSSLAGWDIVIVSPGIPPSTPLLATAKEITTATNIFFADCHGTIIAVTGSKGKSTTASLIAAILEQANQTVGLVGNIGKPGLDVLLSHNDQKDIFVYELSSYQSARLIQGPQIAVILNLFPEHLDYHGGIEQYYQDKLRVTFCQPSEQTVIFNQNNEELAHRIQQSKAKKIFWPDISSAHVNHDVICWKDEEVLPLAQVPLLGKQNSDNVLAALTVAKQFNIDHATIAKAIRSFHPLPHRLECVGTFRGITFYDDAISTTPESTIAALEIFPKIGTLIVGGQDRGYDFTHLAETIINKNIPAMVFFPDSGKRVAEALAQRGYHGETLQTRSMEEAVAFAYAHAPKGSTCLLSCASPSYSIFKNFEDKGNQFQHCVKNRVSHHFYKPRTS